MNNELKLAYIKGMVSMGLYQCELNGSFNKNIALEITEVEELGQQGFYISFRYIKNQKCIPVYVDNSGIIESYVLEDEYGDTMQTFNDYTNTQNVLERLEMIIEEMSIEYYENTKSWNT